ncbi:MAG: Wzt carbohydrate-binding domain-containing protein, partial [Lachnospiraceae bacterium]|nr:Wzt carbohydrate-binding domain-containing protein [Lachnospiraceae bacterium]
MFEKAFLDPCKAGEKKEITFTQQVDLQGGEYLLSFGCTGYEGDDFTVYHRLYDALQLTVVSEKNTVGFYDMNSKVTVKDI